ncbi:MAG: flavodoxin-dependent (E)-4-hydroxy-3-methylbut-2-enyl-diphosphate synthase [Dehalococcoidales bacterium]
MSTNIANSFLKRDRRISKPIQVGSVIIGGEAPIVVQSMTKTDTRDVAATVRQIRELEECGCELVRMAVPDREAAKAIATVKQAISIPVIADIHFDYRLALEALEAGADGLRLNPGNIGEPDRVAAVVRAAKERAVPIRIGVNAGSLPKYTSIQGSVAERMVSVAMQQVQFLESLDFDLIKVSLKAFDIATTVQAYRLIAEKIPYPLHLGITEAGTPQIGAIRSALGIGILLYEGIGDTIRVSLTGHPRLEVLAAYEILKGLHLRERGATLVSCPTCGRCQVELLDLVRAVENELLKVEKPIKVAVMGCEVNGPGEARDADVGIACGKGRGAIFRNGRVVGTVSEKDLLSALMAQVRQL